MDNTQQNNTQQPKNNPSVTLYVQRYALLGASLIVLLFGIAAILILSAQDESSAIAPNTPTTDILFLGPSSEARNNIMHLTVETGRVEQLTDAAGGVLEYAISPDALWIAYTVRVTGRISDIWLLNLNTQQSIQLTNCLEAQASCNTPAWRNNSSEIAYTRRELDQDSGWTNTERVWLVDIQSRQSRPLFDDFNVQGRYPIWSPTNDQVAFSLVDPVGVLLYDFPTDETLFIPSEQGTTGFFSPDGTQLAYPALRFGIALQRYYTHIELLELPRFGVTNSPDPTVSRLSGPIEAPLEDGQAAFHPNGNTVAVTRRYLDERYTQGSQLYLIDLATDAVTPLVVDASYNHAALNWHPSENWLLYQRNALDDVSQIEIWLLDATTGKTTMIENDGYMPKFLNRGS